jgi:hypothetical protein
MSNGWQRAFDYPIPLPGGRKLLTLHDAALFITKLPTAEHNAPEWQAASAVAGCRSRRPDLFARISVMRALTMARAKWYAGLETRSQRNIKSSDDLTEG